MGAAAHKLQQTHISALPILPLDSQARQLCGGQLYKETEAQKVAPGSRSESRPRLGAAIRTQGCGFPIDSFF